MSFDPSGPHQAFGQAFGDAPAGGPDQSIVDALRGLERMMLDQLRVERSRADTAEARVGELERQSTEAGHLVADARAEAESITAKAREEADSLRAAATEEAGRLREQAVGRQRELATALRGYLTDIEDAQATLLRVARRALSAAAVEAPAGDAPAPTAVTVAESPAAEAPAATPAPERYESNGLTAGPVEQSWAPPSAPRWDPPTGPAVPGHPSAAMAPFDMGSQPFPATTTDEHRLIDLHNRLDLDRITDATGARGLFRR